MLLCLCTHSQAGSCDVSRSCGNRLVEAPPVALGSQLLNHFPVPNNAPTETLFSVLSSDALTESAHVFVSCTTATPQRAFWRRPTDPQVDPRHTRIRVVGKRKASVGASVVAPDPTVFKNPNVHSFNHDLAGPISAWVSEHTVVRERRRRTFPSFPQSTESASIRSHLHLASAGGVSLVVSPSEANVARSRQVELRLMSQCAGLGFV